MNSLALTLTGVLAASACARAGSVAVVGERFDLNIIAGFYNSLPGDTAKVISSIDGASLAGVDLLWAVQPSDAYTPTELSAMDAFIDGGGRIAFMGEHGLFAPSENNRISTAISALGGHISIINLAPDAGFHDATVANGQILPHSLTTGVYTYNYACFAPLLSVWGSAEKLMLGSNLSDVMMGYENIGPGSIFVITDQNVWDNVYNVSSNDNGRMFENLLEASTGAPPVPDAGATFGLFALASGALLGARRRFVVSSK